MISQVFVNVKALLTQGNKLHTSLGNT